MSSADGPGSEDDNRSETNGPRKAWPVVSELFITIQY